MTFAFCARNRELLAHRPLVGQLGSLAWWFDGERLRIAHADRPCNTTSSRRHRGGVLRAAG